VRSLTAERNLNNAKSFETSRTETANPLPIGDWVRRSGKRCVGLGVAQKRMKKTIARLCAADASSGFYDNLFELPKPRGLHCRVDQRLSGVKRRSESRWPRRTTGGALLPPDRQSMEKEIFTIPRR